MIRHEQWMVLGLPWLVTTSPQRHYFPGCIIYLWSRGPVSLQGPHTALVTPVSAQVDTTPPPPACYLVAMWSGGHTCPLQTPDSDRAWRQGRCLTRLNCQDYWYWRSYSGHNWLRVSSLTIQNIHLIKVAFFFLHSKMDGSTQKKCFLKRCSSV